MDYSLLVWKVWVICGQGCARLACLAAAPPHVALELVGQGQERCAGLRGWLAAAQSVLWWQTGEMRLRSGCSACACVCRLLPVLNAGLPSSGGRRPLCYAPGPGAFAGEQGSIVDAEWLEDIHLTLTVCSSPCLTALGVKRRVRHVREPLPVVQGGLPGAAAGGLAGGQLAAFGAQRAGAQLRRME